MFVFIYIRKWNELTFLLLHLHHFCCDSCFQLNKPAWKLVKATENLLLPATSFRSELWCLGLRYKKSSTLSLVCFDGFLFFVGFSSFFLWYLAYKMCFWHRRALTHKKLSQMMSIDSWWNKSLLDEFCVCCQGEYNTINLILNNIVFNFSVCRLPSQSLFLKYCLHWKLFAFKCFWLNLCLIFRNAFVFSFLRWSGLLHKSEIGAVCQLQVYVPEFQF